MIADLSFSHADAAIKAPKTIPNDDRDLVADLRAGLPHALEELVRRYRTRLHAVAYRWTRNHHDAEEVVQETFVRAYRAAPRFRGDSALGTWLHAIATNSARNRYWHWRRRKGDVTVSIDSPEALAEVTAWQDATAQDDRAEFEQHDLERSISESIERLPERDRRILYLRTRDHATYEEMARILGIEIGTVKSRLARAREHLRSLVATEGEFDASTAVNAPRIRSEVFASPARA